MDLRKPALVHFDLFPASVEGFQKPYSVWAYALCKVPPIGLWNCLKDLCHALERFRLLLSSQEAESLQKHIG